MSRSTNMIDGIFKSVAKHPYLAAAAGGALIAAAGGLLAIRQQIRLEQLGKATDEDIEAQIQTGAIAY